MLGKVQLQAGDRAKLTVLASAISAIFAGSHPAYAQPPPAGATEEVVVTGSRIARRDFEAATPIMTVESERLEQSSTLSVETVLNQMPQFTPAQSQFTAVGEIQTSPVGSLGVGTLNLRGISTNRTLVLIDGRRAQPANASLVVDINTIPSAAIQRVETITGGASAVYGADALAGVVNFVLKDDFEGISVDLHTSATEAGDGEETRVSSLIGMNSDSGKANMLLGVEWYDRNASFQKNHDFYVDGWHDPNNPAGTFFPSMPAYSIDANNRPTQAALDALFAGRLPAGTVPVTTPGLSIFYNKDGTAYARGSSGQTWGFNDSQLELPFGQDGMYGLIRNRDGTLQQIYMDTALANPLTRKSAFGKAHVDITDHLRGFVQANFVRSEVSTFSAGPPPAVGAAWGGAIPNDGRPLPAGLQNLLNSRQLDPDGAGPAPVGAPGTGATRTWLLNRGLDFLGQFGPTNSSDVYQILAGFKGDFPNRDWTWEAYYSSGETSATNVYYGLPSVQRWKAIIAAPNFGANAFINYLTDVNGAPVLDASGNRQLVGGNYQITCTSGVPTFPGGPAAISADCVNGMLGRYKSQTTISQDILEANMQGKIADMKAGELRFAAGVTNRKNDFSYEPSNPQSTIFDYPLGLFVSNATTGSTEVSELYGELLLPIVKKLDLELGYRWSDYDSAAGKVGTYKVLFDWSATESMRLRGGYQRANRAPNTAELFQAETTIFETTFSSADPCGVNTNATWGNRASNPNQLKVQQLCAALIGNTTSTFGAPGSVAANTYLQGVTPFTGINGIQRGNPDLKSEEAETWTLGLVFNGPGGLDNLTASVDFYNIEISDAIATFNGFQIYSNCFNANGVSNPGYSINDPKGFCALINRDAGTGAASTVEELYLNTGSISTAGVDLQVNWQHDVGSGSFYMNHLVSYLDKFDTQTTPSDPVLHYKGTLGNSGQYDYRLNSTFGYRFAGSAANVGLRFRYLPEVKNGAFVTDPRTVIIPTEAWSMYDVFGSYDFNQRFRLQAGIDNIFDIDPAVVGATPTDSNSASTLASYYDPLGRRLWVSLNVQF